MTNDEMAASYYKVAMMKRKPEVVPSTVRVKREMFGDGPFRGKGVAAGDHACQCNAWGAVSVVDRGGVLLGLCPDEFDVLSWRHVVSETESAGTSQQGQ